MIRIRCCRYISVVPVCQCAIISLPCAKYYTPPSRDLYCSPCRLYGPTYRSSLDIPLEEVIQITSPGGYLDNLLGRLCEF